VGVLELLHQVGASLFFGRRTPRPQGQAGVLANHIAFRLQVKPFDQASSSLTTSDRTRRSGARSAVVRT